MTAEKIEQAHALRMQRMALYRQTQQDIRCDNELKSILYTLGFLTDDLLNPDREYSVISRFHEAHENMQTYLMGAEIQEYLSAMGTNADYYFENARISAGVAKKTLEKIIEKRGVLASDPCHIEMKLVEKHLARLRLDMEEIRLDIKNLPAINEKAWGKALEFSESGKEALKTIRAAMHTFYAMDMSIEAVTGKVNKLNSLQCEL